VIKRVFAFFAVCLLLAPALAAQADLIYEPENDFYEQHSSEILYLGRSFMANGADGFAQVRKEPGASSVIAELQNGEATYFQYSCLYDGDFWGYTSAYSGWVMMDQLLVLYDYISFEEEHLAKFYSYGGDYGEIRKEAAAIAWPWPGAEAPLWTFEDLDVENFWVSHAYTDDYGREWGFVTYLYGYRSIWICLSDPLNRGLAAQSPAPEPEQWVSDTEHTEIAVAGGLSPEVAILAIIIVMVLALAVGTVVLIKVLWKPAKN